MLFYYRLLHLSILIQLAFSAALWWPSSARTFPAYGLWATPPAFLSWILSTLWVALTLAFVGGKIKIKWYAATAITLVSCLVILDLNRLQVWVWFWALLWAADLLGKGYSTHRWLLAAVYAWGGANKLTPWFSVNFDWFCEAFPLTAPFAGNTVLSYAAALSEMMIALLLLWRPCRKWGIALSILMHCYILLVIGPLGYDWNRVVWPWNLAMAGLVALFFYDKMEFDLRLTIATLPVWIVAWLLPILNWSGYWPESLSWKMYSNTQREATIYSKNGAPCAIISQIWEKNAFDNQYLLIDNWCSEELGVPAFNSIGNFKNIFETIKKCAADTAQIELKVLTVNRWSRDENLQLEKNY